MPTVEQMRQVLRAARPGADEETLDRCGGEPREIEHMRQAHKANES